MWKARLKNGTEISELNSKWDDVKNDVVELLLITNDNKIVYLPKNMESYNQFKSASCSMGGNDMQIESRVIGFKLGNKMVNIRVNEKNGNINVEIE
jgi:hypothetical protein